MIFFLIQAVIRPLESGRQRRITLSSGGPGSRWLSCQKGSQRGLNLFLFWKSPLGDILHDSDRSYSLGGRTDKEYSTSFLDHRGLKGPRGSQGALSLFFNNILEIPLGDILLDSGRFFRVGGRTDYDPETYGENSLSVRPPTLKKRPELRRILPSLSFCLLLKFIMRHPYLKILDLANLFVANAPMKKKNQEI